MQATKTTTAESAIWGRLFGPESTTLTPEAARAILAIDFPDTDKRRIDDLAAKARRGTLTTDEQDEIDSYGRIGSFISMMKSKARVALRHKRNGSASQRHA
jgi:hypothetical protein